MRQNLVSVILTTKNSGKTLNSLLKSVKNQTYKRVEVIVVDNDSSDNTREIAKKYTKEVYISGPERSAQRNYGAQKAKGKFLMILDADMELTVRVIEDCVNTALASNLKALVIPERTIGNGLIPRIRQFEREMYMGDFTIEVARFFDKKIFHQFRGYDLRLTGPEDYDLPYRISQKYKVGRTHEYILHDEQGLTLLKLLEKKFYYASKGALYAQKYPELVRSQGNLLFRKAYIRNWKNFVRHPFLGISFIFVRFLETIWAVAGYISAVGLAGFTRTFLKMFIPRKI